MPWAIIEADERWQAIACYLRDSKLDADNRAIKSCEELGATSRQAIERKLLKDGYVKCQGWTVSVTAVDDEN